MSTSQDEIINLTDFNSPSSSSNKFHFKTAKLKRKNKIKSSSKQSLSGSEQNSDISSLFLVKNKKFQPESQDDTSDLSEDGLTNEKSWSKSTTTKSYRDKINDRFKIIRNKAGKSTLKASSQEPSQKFILNKIKNDSDNINAEIQSIRNKFKLNERATPSVEEMRNFFCYEKGEGQNFEESAEKKLLIDETDNPVQFMLPERSNFLAQLSEKELFFVPNGKKIEIENKIEGGEIRYLEDEGLYVPAELNVPSREINKIEQRLLSYDDKKWFNCEGKLSIVENPITKTSLRPQQTNYSVITPTKYSPAKSENHTECEEISIIEDNILNFQIESLQFIHHPLMSMEHVLERKLLSLHHKHNEFLKSNRLKRIDNRLEAMRHIKTKTEQIKNESGDTRNYDEKILGYTLEIRNLREKLFEEGRKERECLKLILETWRCVKKIREQQNYSNTSVKLLIHKEKVDYVDEKENWERRIEEFLQELLMEETKLDEESIKLDLHKRFEESFKPPGEPTVRFTLTRDNEISKIVDNPKENLRRNVVKSTKLFIKIICNLLEVCKSKTILLNDNFQLNFRETFSIQVANIPKCINLEIFEQSGSLLKRKLGEINIILPLTNILRVDKTFKETQFEKNEIVHYKHEGIGSGIQLKSLIELHNLDVFRWQNELNTSGSLTYLANWEKIGNNFNGEKNREEISKQIIDKHGVIDEVKLKEWLGRNKPDPQDPKNSIFYQYSENCNQDMLDFSKNEKNYFRLSPFMKSIQFCDISEIEDNLRLKILQLRNANEPEFDRMVVPNRVKEIDLNFLADYKRRIATDMEDFDEDLLHKRTFGQKYLKQVQIRVFQQCKSTDNNLTFEDVVDEKFLVHFQKIIQTFATNLLDWFRWRPKMPQFEQLGEKLKLQTQENATCTKIRIKLKSGSNIPKKLNEVTTRPFVEINYNNVTIKSSTNEGSNPTWNEEIILPIESTHMDYLNPNALNGHININLFDENEQELKKLIGTKTKNFLGCTEIPISAICNCNSISGKFKIKVPHLLSGYDKPFEVAKSPKTITNSSNIPIEETYLDLVVSVEPKIPKLSPNIEEWPCNDLPYIRDHALKWGENYNNTFPSRKFSVFAINTKGQTALITRYIKPLEPPQINSEEFDVTPEQCLRFTSLIPFTDCNQFYQNIWLSTDEFLRLMIGSIIDHAVTLTCYLLALKLDAWLLLGFGIPHGSTGYVLIREYSRDTQMPRHSIYDCYFGEKYDLIDANCPLQKIYCVINETNIWANIQRSDNISLTRFDFNRKSDWLSLFNNRISAPSNSIQKPVSYLEKSNVEELESQIEWKLKKKICKLRPFTRTFWNREVCDVFKNALVTLENKIMYNKSNFDYSSVKLLKECMEEHQIKGNSINLPFSNIFSIFKRIKTFGIHLNEESDEFVLAVHLKSYPNQVLTVWVFFGIITQH